MLPPNVKGFTDDDLRSVAIAKCHVSGADLNRRCPEGCSTHAHSIAAHADTDDLPDRLIRDRHRSRKSRRDHQEEQASPRAAAGGPDGGTGAAAVGGLRRRAGAAGAGPRPPQTRLALEHAQRARWPTSQPSACRARSARRREQWSRRRLRDATTRAMSLITVWVVEIYTNDSRRLALNARRSPRLSASLWRLRAPSPLCVVATSTGIQCEPA